MNKQRRMAVQMVYAEISELDDGAYDCKKVEWKERIKHISGRLRIILKEEQSALDNTPENLLDSMRGEESQEAIDSIEETLCYISDAIKQYSVNDISSAKDSLQSAMYELDNIV